MFATYCRAGLLTNRVNVLTQPASQMLSNDNDKSEDLDSWKIFKYQADIYDDMSMLKNATSDSEQSILYVFFISLKIVQCLKFVSLELLS